VVGRKLAARVLNTWHEDFVDEDTGEVISIERNEIVIDRDTVIEKDHIEEILEAECKTILTYIKKMRICLTMPSSITPFKKILPTLKKKP
jgi:hypothetical protein